LKNEVEVDNGEKKLVLTGSRNLGSGIVGVYMVIDKSIIGVCSENLKSFVGFHIFFLVKE